MRFLRLIFAAVIAFAIASPATAQDGNLSLYVLVNVESEDTPDFEAALVEHNAWHAEQNDPTPWVTYMALTGTVQDYIIFAPARTWAWMDQPAVDIHADQMHWSNSGAQHTVSEEIFLMASLDEMSRMPENPAEYPVVQVFSWEITGDENHVTRAIESYKEAVDEAGADVHFEWSRSVSSDGPTEYVIALFAESFEALGDPGPNPMDLMAESMGVAETASVFQDFGDAVAFTGSRIWVFRPDLSYVPEM